jgi:predicted 3-demethylubiquinone-9 3-methyltransferase (glyoxalase superfamily)
MRLAQRPLGLSWQITPKRLGELMSDPDRRTAKRVAEAMLKIVKFDIEGLEAAARGKAVSS